MAGFRVTIVDSPTGREPSMQTLRNLAKFVVRQMNIFGRNAHKTTQQRDWPPFDTGLLQSSIRWDDARHTGNANFTPGHLSANVPYARLYEVGSNHPRRRYLGRAIDKNEKAFLRALRNRKVVEDIMIGRTSAQLGSIARSVRRGFR